jgi:hypothetical protein
MHRRRWYNRAFDASCEPGCVSPAQVFLIDPNLQMTPMLERVLGPGSTRRIAYLGKTWPAEDRLGLRVEWLKQKCSRASAWGDT